MPFFAPGVEYPFAIFDRRIQNQVLPKFEELTRSHELPCHEFRPGQEARIALRLLQVTGRTGTTRPGQALAVPRDRNSGSRFRCWDRSA